jgi:aryl-alcohol dehydrogenase-like predicted oxidoreductase
MTTDTHRVRAERNLYAIRYIADAHAKGTPVTDAIRQVAAEQGRDPSSVSSAWYRANPSMRRTANRTNVTIPEATADVTDELAGIHADLVQLRQAIDSLAAAFVMLIEADNEEGSDG